MYVFLYFCMDLNTGGILWYLKHLMKMISCRIFEWIKILSCMYVNNCIQNCYTVIQLCVNQYQWGRGFLWFLATPSEYRTISHLFGIGRSTVCCIIHETVRAILKVLLKKYISFLLGNQLQNVIQGFEDKCNFPQCAGAIDGSHIPIQAPKLNHTDYYNRKGWYSILV